MYIYLQLKDVRKQSGHCILPAFEIMAIFWKHALSLSSSKKQTVEKVPIHSRPIYTANPRCCAIKLRWKNISKGESLAWIMWFAAPLYHFISHISFCCISSKEVTGICQNVLSPMFEILAVNTLIQSITQFMFFMLWFSFNTQIL